MCCQLYNSVLRQSLLLFNRKSLFRNCSCLKMSDASISFRAFSTWLVGQYVHVHTHACACTIIFRNFFFFFYLVSLVKHCHKICLYVNVNFTMCHNDKGGGRWHWMSDLKLMNLLFVCQPHLHSRQLLPKLGLISSTERACSRINLLSNIDD